MTRRLPIIHGVTEHDAGPYRMETLDLEFSNGERRRYERLHGRNRGAGPGAVVVVPMLDDETVLLVREYAAGVHRYELGLVKGRIDAGENAIEAADRELKEEAGYGARSLTVLRTLTLAPTYMSHQAHLVLARSVSAAPGRRRTRRTRSGAVEARCLARADPARGFLRRPQHRRVVHRARMAAQRRARAASAGHRRCRGRQRSGRAGRADAMSPMP